ncbi:DUF1176 domain-containing protein [Oricola thermophila]|uniref:DUF1176 domain-containing protein n=1 Tax=Oricola thermophila TaxID=2742145 RepID=A0A6N1V8W2_9HYPH|nr:DUF1176 domain-containing protein [Oricola thermophila]QKV17158.1 DUF1176 domain-containing protein [Oricola thermophila]
MRPTPSGSSSFRLLSVTLALLISLFSPESEAREFKRIRDISVDCSDALSCDLSTYNAQSELYTVIFRRRASRDAPVELVLGVRETLAPGSEVTMRIDGAEVVRLPVSELSYRAAVYEYIFRGEAEISKLIEYAKTGMDLRVSYRTRGTETVSAFSLSGFIAGLIFMDEVQGRVGREDALYAAAGTPDRDAAPVREITSFSEIPFQIRGHFSDMPSARCGGMDEDRFADLGGFEARTGDSVYLVGLPCGPGGAYNQPFAFWERTGSSFRAVALPVMSAEGPTTSELAWNISWDQERRELTGFFKGRGLGDCGSFDRWIWTERDEGFAFVLVESRVKAECDGDPGGGPDNWPSLWPPE